MSLPDATVAAPAPVARRRLVAGIVAFAVVSLGGITYAKWWPYAGKVAKVVSTHTYGSKSILAGAGAPGAAPSWGNAWHFTVSYGLDIWVALVAAVLIGAGVEVLLPRSALRRFLGRGNNAASSARGGLLGVPCLMCTCCTAPIAISLRRSQVPVAGTLSYWLSNPLLNPVVLIILAVVLPWQYVVTRILVGAAIVFALAPLLARLAPAPSVDHATAPQHPVRTSLGARTRADDGAATVSRYLRAVGRLSLFILPEYFVIVVALGAFRGWLLPVGHSAATWAVGAAVVAAVAGTLLVIPTAAEVPILLGLIALGVPAVVTGTLLVALPAVSLPSAAMVGRWLSWRVTAGVLVVVMACALAAGALVAAL